MHFLTASLAPRYEARPFVPVRPLTFGLAPTGSLYTVPLLSIGNPFSVVR